MYLPQGCRVHGYSKGKAAGPLCKMGHFKGRMASSVATALNSGETLLLTAKWADSYFSRG